MINKRLGYASIAALLLVVIAGCGDKPAAAPVNEGGIATPAVVSGAGNNTDNSDNTAPEEVVQDVENTPEPTPESNNPATSEPSPTPSPSAAVEKQSQSIEVYYTDNQQMDLVAAQAKISFTSDLEKYTEAYKALQTSEKQDQVSLWGKIELKSLKVEDGQVIIDIHKPEEAQLGAGGEALAISALTKTFFQFEEVKSLDVLVDGQQVESLMGHVDLEHPITRESASE
ncbi:GerMN domain-containing protein [Paenibacillus albidus]|uniref:GerMN domain-containing protein n=1 Tax=Paenibacillus albidus TaxID=2041023 RepID=UPI00203622A8|nr:GerMN domain-containing protein [Paenibacillus albidus]